MKQNEGAIFAKVKENMRGASAALPTVVFAARLLMLDDDALITLGGQKPTMSVWQTETERIMVCGSRRFSRDLTPKAPPREYRRVMTPPPGKKWCSVCGEWVDKAEFTAKARAFDGKHPYCNACRAANERLDYDPEKRRERYERSRARASIAVVA